MANYSTNFTEYATGVIPSDWTARWDASTQFTVETGGADKILKGLLTANNRYACTWNAVDADAGRANVEILTKFRTLSVSAASHCGVVVRASGTATTETGYVAVISTTNLALTSYVSGTGTVLVTQTLSLLANTDYFLRFRANSTALQVRIWLATDAEPTTWGIDTADTNISAAGWNGVFAFSAVSDPEYDAIAIATNGDTASFAAGGITGTGSLTNSAVTATGSGTIAHTGTGAASTNVVSLSGSGVLSHTGTGSPTTSTTTASGSGTATGAGVTGTGAIAVGAVTTSGTGKLTHSGTGALSCNVVAITGRGTLAHTGTGALTNAAATLAGSGFLGLGITGTGAIAIGNVLVSGTANRIGWDAAPSAAGSWANASGSVGAWTDKTAAAGTWT